MDYWYNMKLYAEQKHPAGSKGFLQMIYLFIGVAISATSRLFPELNRVGLPCVIIIKQNSAFYASDPPCPSHRRQLTIGKEKNALLLFSVNKQGIALPESCRCR